MSVGDGVKERLSEIGRIDEKECRHVEDVAPEQIADRQVKRAEPNRRDGRHEFR